MMIRLLVDNVLIGTRVCSKGDVVDLPSHDRKRQLVTLGIAEWFDPPKPKPKPEAPETEHKHKPEAPESAVVEHATHTAAMPKPSRKTRPDNV